jgi:hypothetical protein
MLYRNSRTVLSLFLLLSLVDIANVARNIVKYSNCQNWCSGNCVDLIRAVAGLFLVLDTGYHADVL